MAPLTITTTSPEETRVLGERLGRLLGAGDVVLLHGDLGAGKTTLTQGIARGLGWRDYVQSPTFTLVAEHRGALPDGTPVCLYHLDLYRLSGDEAELDSFGFDQYLGSTDGVTVIEWPERAGAWLPDAYLLVNLDLAGPSERRISVAAYPSDREGASVLSRLAADLEGTTSETARP
jgi:tRNA threonylcarbamoyladenosine biosynthesis protein TsaE